MIETIIQMNSYANLVFVQDASLLFFFPSPSYFLTIYSNREIPDQRAPSEARREMPSGALLGALCCQFGEGVLIISNTE